MVRAPYGVTAYPHPTMILEGPNLHFGAIPRFESSQTDGIRHTPSIKCVPTRYSAQHWKLDFLQNRVDRYREVQAMPGG